MLSMSQNSRYPLRIYKRKHIFYLARFMSCIYVKRTTFRKFLSLICNLKQTAVCGYIYFLLLSLSLSVYNRWGKQLFEVFFSVRGDRPWSLSYLSCILCQLLFRIRFVGLLIYSVLSPLTMAVGGLLKSTKFTRKYIIKKKFTLFGNYLIFN